jgi:archaeal type IV pilus assembly protein PilA
MNYNKIIRKFKKNSKGLSPVVASIILIAVTVAVSVVVAAWMGGMTIGLMGNAEQVSVTNYAFSADGTQVTIDVRNTGTATVTLSSATIDGTAVTTITQTTNVSPAPSPGDMNLGKGATATFTLTKSGDPFNAGAQYSIKLVTAKGTTVPYTVTYNP